MVSLSRQRETMEKSQEKSMLAASLEAAYPLERPRKQRPLSNCMIFILASLAVVTLGFLTAYAVLNMESSPPAMAEEIHRQEDISPKVRIDLYLKTGQQPQDLFQALPPGSRVTVNADLRQTWKPLDPISADQLGKMVYHTDQQIPDKSNPSTHTTIIRLNNENGLPDSDGLDSMTSKVSDILNSVNSRMSDIFSSFPPFRMSEESKIQDRRTSSPFGSDQFFEKIPQRSFGSSETSGPLDSFFKMISGLSSMTPSPAKPFRIIFFRKPQEEDSRESPIDDHLRSILQKHEMEKVEGPSTFEKIFQNLFPEINVGSDSEEDSNSEDVASRMNPLMNDFPSISSSLSPLFGLKPLLNERDSNINEKSKSKVSASSEPSPNAKLLEKTINEESPKLAAVKPSTGEEKKSNHPAEKKAESLTKVEEQPRNPEKTGKIVKRESDPHTAEESTVEKVEDLPSTIQV